MKRLIRLSQDLVTAATKMPLYKASENIADMLDEFTDELAAMENRKDYLTISELNQIMKTIDILRDFAQAYEGQG